MREVELVSTLEMMLMSGNPVVVLFAYCVVGVVVLALFAMILLLAILIWAMIECW